MWTRFLPESLDKASITIEEAFAYCRAHPVAGIDLERLLGIFTTDTHSIVDGAKPFEWIGGDIDKIDAATFPAVFERLRDTARGLRIPAVDITLSGHW